MFKEGDFIFSPAGRGKLDWAQVEGTVNSKELEQLSPEKMKELTKTTPWIAKHKTEMLITFIAVVAILGFISTLIGVTGGLSIASSHLGLLSHLSPLNTAFTSIWKGFPYLLAAFGAPGVLLFLGAMVVGVFYAICKLANRKLNKTASEQEEANEESRASLSKKPENSFKERFSILDKIRGRETFNIECEATATKTLHKYKLSSVLKILEGEKAMYLYQMERKNAIFVFIDKENKDPEKKYCVLDPQDGVIIEKRYSSYKDVLNEKNERAIITDVETLRDLVKIGKNDKIYGKENKKLYATQMEDEAIVFAYKDHQDKRYHLVFSENGTIKERDYDSFNDLQLNVKTDEEIITSIDEFKNLMNKAAYADADNRTY